MLLKCNGSGSKGNNYSLICDDEILLLEAGVHAKDMLRSIDYQVNKVVGCLITHVHQDHSKYVSDYMRYGIRAYSSDAVSKDIEEMCGEKVACMQRMRKTQLGGFSIVPFCVPHNETECDGFLISHEKIGCMLFITDAEYCPYSFQKSKINHAFIECNYSIDYLGRDFANYEHVLRGHMELETCKRLIRVLNSPTLRSIGLLHLSGGNSDSKRFVHEIAELVDCDVSVAVADSGTVHELKLEPF